MAEYLTIVLIEDTDEDAKLFERQIRGVVNIPGVDLIIQRFNYPDDALKWLSSHASKGILPDVICIDSKIKGLSLESVPGVLMSLQRYCPGYVFGYTDVGENSEFWQTMIDTLGHNSVFQKMTWEKSSESQIFSVLKTVLQDRTSSGGRTLIKDVMQIRANLALIEERADRAHEAQQKEIQYLKDQVTVLEKLLRYENPNNPGLRQMAYEAYTLVQGNTLGRVKNIEDELESIRQQLKTIKAQMTAINRALMVIAYLWQFAKKHWWSVTLTIASGGGLIAVARLVFGG